MSRRAFSRQDKINKDSSSDPSADSTLSRIDDNIDLSSYVDNSGWILLNVTFLRREKYKYKTLTAQNKKKNYA